MFPCPKFFRGGMGWRGRALLSLALLPMALSPTHPVAVYGYLASVYAPVLMRPAFAGSEEGLVEFLTTPAQVQQYRESLLADMANTRGGEVFAIVRDNDGRLAHTPIRTWNSFLPERLPKTLSGWLDRKEFPFLGDEVALWLAGQSITAMGHYHVFGGPPSAGDRVTQWMCDLPEIVVSNGVIPLVYLRGEIIPYGSNVEVAPAVLRSMRALEPSLRMDVLDPRVIPIHPSAATLAALSYLRDHHGVDIAHRVKVAAGFENLCLRFKREYASIFQHGYTIAPYGENPDQARLLQNLAALHGWASIYCKLAEPSQGSGTRLF